MKKKLYSILFVFIFPTFQLLGQSSFIFSKEGRPILNRRQVLANCLNALNKSQSDKTAVAICECEAAMIDGYFSNKQYKKHTKNGLIDMSALIKEDTLLNSQIQSCYTRSGKTMLLQAEGFESEFVENCIKHIKTNTEKSLNPDKVKNFCLCQLQLVRTKKISDSEMVTLSNPNSLLFFEMMYTCGNPFMEKNETGKNWDSTMVRDIKGELTDTVKVLSLNGMTYLKIKVGSTVQFWLFDTGASDLLINNDMEEILKNENITSVALL